MSETCAPPPAHQDKPWHWLRHEDGEWLAARWLGTRWVMVDEFMIFEGGWRYVAPCVPPPASEGEG